MKVIERLNKREIIQLWKRKIQWLRKGWSLSNFYLSKPTTSLMKGDAVQSSEKLYKAAEECIKALSEIFKLEEVKAAEEKGRWTVTLLEKAVRKLTNNLGIEVQLRWDAANHLHIWVFMRQS